MPEGMTPNVLDDIGLADCLLDRSLENGFMSMMTALLTGLCVFPSVFLGKDPMPAPVGGSVGILAIKSIGHENPPPDNKRTWASDPLVIMIGGFGGIGKAQRPTGPGIGVSCEVETSAKVSCIANAKSIFR